MTVVLAARALEQATTDAFGVELIVEHVRPRAVLFENVPGFASAKFESYRRELLTRLSKMGYQPEYRILQQPSRSLQLRPRFVLVALAPKDAEFFAWPAEMNPKETVGTTLVGPSWVRTDGLAPKLGQLVLQE